MDEYKNNILHKIKIYAVSYFPLFYILEGVKVGDFSSITQVFSQKVYKDIHHNKMVKSIARFKVEMHHLY